jgi:predicted metal-dependent hydrolase
MQRRIEYGSAVIEYILDWTTRQKLSISVDLERVSVVAPHGVDPEDVDKRVKRRARWILRQQRKFAEFKPVTPERKYIGGETHRYLGRQYRLKIEPAMETERVRLLAGRIVVESHRPTDPSATRDLVGNWLRQRAHEVLRQRFEAAAPIADRLGIAVPHLRICEMKKRWGSHTPSGRIILNDRLIAARRDCIDYVIIHELCHVAEPNHSSRFFRLLSRTLPDWRERKERLERSTA